MATFFSEHTYTPIKFIAPALIIGALVWLIEPSQWQQLSEQPKHYGLLLAALFLMLTAMCTSFFRWCILVRCQNISLSMLEAFRLGSICFLLSFVSVGSIGGDLFKAIFLARRRPGKRIEAVASVIVDRVSGLYGLLFLVVIAGLFLQPKDVDASPTILLEMQAVALLMFATGTAVLLFLILGGQSVDRLLQAAGSRRSLGRLIARVGSPLRTFHAYPKVFGFSVILSMIVQSLFALSVYLIANSLYNKVPTLTEHFVIVPLGKLASAVPITPGGIGVWEAAIDALYQLIPSQTTAASGTLIAIVFEMLNLLLALIGVVFYWTANEEVRESLGTAEETPEVQDKIPSEASSPKD